MERVDPSPPRTAPEEAGCPRRRARCSTARGGATTGSSFRSQSADHTLQPTALVHEAYLKLVGDPDRRGESRGHFCAVASAAMPQIRSVHARARRALKRGGGGSQRESLTVVELPSGTDAIELIQLDDILTARAETDERGPEANAVLADRAAYRSAISATAAAIRDGDAPSMEGPAHLKQTDARDQGRPSAKRVKSAHHRVPGRVPPRPR